MKPMIAMTAAAVALTFAVAVHATEIQSAGAGANTVAGMLQRKHDTELRANLVNENRWTEVRQLDAATALKSNAQHNAALERVNKQLAHDTGADATPVNARALECAADETHVR